MHHSLHTDRFLRRNASMQLCRSSFLALGSPVSCRRADSAGPLKETHGDSSRRHPPLVSQPWGGIGRKGSHRGTQSRQTLLTTGPGHVSEREREGGCSPTRGATVLCENLFSFWGISRRLRRSSQEMVPQMTLSGTELQRSRSPPSTAHPFRALSPSQACRAVDAALIPPADGTAWTGPRFHGLVGGETVAAGAAARCQIALACRC